MAASTSGKIRIASAYETNPSPQGPPMVQPFSPGVPSGDLIQPVQTKSEGRQTPTAPELEVLALRIYPVGPKRSTRIWLVATPASMSRSVAESANPGDPHT